jgi:ribosomal protein S25
MFLASIISMETYNRTLARTIDLINEYVIKYYNREIEKKPDPLVVQSEIWNRYKINHVIFEYALRIMKEENYIEYIFNDEEDTTFRELRLTPKGLLLYLNGGMESQLKRDEAKSRLYKIGQISLLIAAVYYLLEIAKTLLSFPNHCH